MGSTASQPGSQGPPNHPRHLHQTAAPRSVLQASEMFLKPNKARHWHCFHPLDAILVCQSTPSTGTTVSVTGPPTLLCHVPPPPLQIPITLSASTSCPRDPPPQVCWACIWVDPYFSLSGPPPPPSTPAPCLPGLGSASVTTIATITHPKPYSSLHQSTDLWAPSPTPHPLSK